SCRGRNPPPPGRSRLLPLLAPTGPASRRRWTLAARSRRRARAAPAPARPGGAAVERSPLRSPGPRVRRLHGAGLGLLSLAERAQDLLGRERQAVDPRADRATDGVADGRADRRERRLADPVYLRGVFRLQ